MSRWTKAELEKISDIDFAIAVLNERRGTTTNAYSLLNQKISRTIRTLEKIKEENDGKSILHNK